jgi:opine dehydrogenase
VTSSRIERIAILGAGPGGVAGAAVLARRGFDVRLFNRTPERVAPIQEAGGVTIDGDLGEEFVPLPIVTTDIAEALRDRELVFCFTPANGQRVLAELAAPHLSNGVIYLLASGSAGSLEVARILGEAGLDVIDSVLVGETLTLPQSARMTGPASLRIKLPSTVRLAAFPARNNDRLYEAVGDLISFRPAPNVLDTGINNVNFLIHPGPMLLNYAAVERADGLLSLMNEGMTPGVLRCMDALDREKMALAAALGLEPASIDELYAETGSGPEVYRRTGEPFRLRDRIWPRYIHEDTPYGTVMLSSLGRQLGVPMPVSDAVNTLLSVVEEIDFRSLGRTAETLGLAGLDAAGMTHYLHHGTRPDDGREALASAGSHGSGAAY